MEPKSFCVFGLALAMITLCGNAEAGEAFSKDFFDIELFSLSKHTEDAFDAPAAVYIVTAEDIRRSGATMIPDVLRMVPGMQVFQQQSNSWAISSRGFATQFTNKLLVLVDGRAVYKPLFSGVFWDMQDMPLENIDRIEVIRGPGGTIWGSNAVNGVINIITKKTSAVRGNFLSTSFGTGGRRVIDAIHNGSTDAGHNYRIYAHSADQPSLDKLGGGTANDNWSMRSAGFRSDSQVSENDSVTVEGAFKSSILNNFFSQIPVLTVPYLAIEPHTKFQQNAHLISKWDHKIDLDSSTQTQIYFDYDNLRTGIADWTEYTLDGDFQYNKRLNDIHQLTTGLGIRYDLIEQENPAPDVVQYRKPTRHYPLASAFLQDKIQLLPNSMFLTLGSKVEYNIFSGIEYQPSARLAYYPDDNQTLWASVTRAVRSPSIGEKDAIIRLAGTPGGFVARSFASDYDSENLVAYEAGYRIIPQDQLLFEATAFYNDYTNLRTGEAGTPFANVSVPLVTRNNGYGTTRGIEFNGKLQVNKDWRLQASYTFMQMLLKLKAGAVDNAFKVQEKQTPTQQFIINSFYNVTPEIEFDNSLYYTGKVVGLTAAQPIRSNLRLDSRIAWRIREDIDISLVGQNLLSEKHQEYQPSLYSPPEEVSRSFFVKLSARF